MLLVVPFLMQISLAVGLTGYFSWRNGQRAVESLAQQVMVQTGRRVDQHLESYLAVARGVNQLNQAAIRQGRFNLRDLRTAGQLFWQQTQTFPAITCVGYALTDGTHIGAQRFSPTAASLGNASFGTYINERSAATGWKTWEFVTDAQGNRQRVRRTATYDPLVESWYTEPLQAKRERWTSIFVSNASHEGEYIAASLNAPIVNAAGQVEGVIGVDLLLSDISRFLQGLRFSATGKMVVMERTGLVVAHSNPDKPYRVVAGKAERLSALEVPDPQVREIADQLQQKLGGWDRIQSEVMIPVTVAGAMQSVQVRPWTDPLGLDWLVLVAVPEADFMGQIQANARTTLGLCGVALVGAGLLGWASAQWISRSIGALTQAAGEIATGNLTPKIPASPIQEVNLLAEALHQMAQNLHGAFSQLDDTNEQLAQANQALEHRVALRTQDLSTALAELKMTQAQLIQSEKMSSLGQLVAGIAHEINNPVGFIAGNLDYVQQSVEALLDLVQLYQAHLPTPPAAIQAQIETMDLAFFQRDFAKAMASMQVGSDRIRTIVLSLRTFSRLEEEGGKVVDLHACLDSIVLLLHQRLSSRCQAITVERHYGELPKVWCYPGPLNQAVMNILINAIEVLEAQPDGGALLARRDGPTIRLQTEYVQTECVQTECVQTECVQTECVQTGCVQTGCVEKERLGTRRIRITIANNGPVIPPDIQTKLFDPFFTTKAVGQGTGLGLSVAYQVITQQHRGQLDVMSNDAWTVFTLEIPMEPHPA
jgi:signal transduction histidine kinase